MHFLFSIITAALLTFNSPNLKQTDSVLVFSPDGANADTPALVLLHGRSGRYNTWSQKMDLQALSRETGFRIICPDGFRKGWYLDVEGGMLWRTFFWEELWPVLVEKYGMKPDRTFIDGLSMGGHGAMSVFLDHPDRFRGAGSMSGVLNLTHSGTAPKDIAKMVGRDSIPQTDLLKWSAVNRLDRLAQVCPDDFKEKLLLVSCGDRDKRYVPTAQDFADSCRAKGYRYIHLVSPGKHEWPVWTWTIRYHLDWFRQAMTPDSSAAKKKILENPYYAGGTYCLYDFDAIPAPTPAPKGYKPVYISHYGRHGARYLEENEFIDGVMKVMRRGHSSGALTPYGENLYSILEDYMAVQAANIGQLSSIGREQHSRIAENTFAAYPEVFKGRIKVDAVSTPYERCVQSMESFCSSLQQKNPKLEVTMDSGPQYCDYLNPHSSKGANWKGVSPRKSAFYRVDEWGQFTLPTMISREVPCREIIERIFKEYQFVREWDDPNQFLYYLYHAVVDAYDIPEQFDFSDVFTPEELYGLWRSYNFYMYNTYGPGRYQDLEALQHIVATADEDLARNEHFARLRFGHDTIVTAILWMLNADHMGEKPSDALHIEDYYQSYRITMASTIILAFYKNKSGDILVKCTLNGQELELPYLTAVSGPYYRWSDLRKYCTDFLEQHKLH